MRIITWIIRLAIFLVLFGFAIKNDQLVTVNFYVETQWLVPLVVVILIAFAIGGLIGFFASLGTRLRQRREIARLRRDLKRAEAAAEDAAGVPVHSEGALVKAA